MEKMWPLSSKGLSGLAETGWSVSQQIHSLFHDNVKVGPGINGECGKGAVACSLSWWSAG